MSWTSANTSDLNSPEQFSDFNHSLINSLKQKFFDLTKELDIIKSLDSHLDTEDNEIKIYCLVSHVARFYLIMSTYINCRLEFINNEIKKTYNTLNIYKTSQSELIYEQRTSLAVTKFFSTLSNHICLKNCSEDPPKNLFVKIRVLKDCGCIQTENGPIFLTPSTSHFVRKAYVDDLIRKGYVSITK